MKKYLYGLILFFLFKFSPLNADLESRTQFGGTDDAYSQATVSPAASGFYTTLIGLFHFADGITFDADHGVRWYGAGVMNGTINNPNGYYVYLYNDLHLGPNATFTSPGGASILVNNGNKIYFDGDGISLGVPLALRSGNVEIDGLGHSFTLGSSVYVYNQVVAGSPSLIMSNMTIINQRNKMFYSLTASDASRGTLTLKNVVIKATGTDGQLLDGSSIAEPVGVTISGNVSIEGFGTRFAIGGDIVIGSNSMLYIGPGVTLTEVSGITMTDETSVLFLDGCTFYTGFASTVGGNSASVGLTLTKGTVFFNDRVSVVNSAYGQAANTAMENGLIFGDGTANNNVDVRVLGGAYVTVNGCVKYNHS